MKLTDRELATVLAALREWQRDCAPQPVDIDNDPTIFVPLGSRHHFEKHAPLTEDEIDTLCERLNLEDK